MPKNLRKVAQYTVYLVTYGNILSRLGNRLLEIIHKLPVSWASIRALFKIWYMLDLTCHDSN